MVNQKKEKKKREGLFCPRCKKGREHIIVYGETFECVNCGAEFDIEDFETIEDLDSLLSNEEKFNIIKTLKSDKKNEEPPQVNSNMNKNGE